MNPFRHYEEESRLSIHCVRSRRGDDVVIPLVTTVLVGRLNGGITMVALGDLSRNDVVLFKENQPACGGPVREAVVVDFSQVSVASTRAGVESPVMR